MEKQLAQAKKDSRLMQTLSNATKNLALETFAELLKSNVSALLAANQKDQQESRAISPQMLQRLKLNEEKINQIIQGIFELIKLPDPCGQITLHRELDRGLELTRVTVPIGVIGIVFESRPDVIAQILALILKSGNCAVLKGGSEAIHTNKAFMELVMQLNKKMPELPEGWATLIETRAQVSEMLAFHQYIDLVIPRGSNQLVKSVMAATKIPVLGHADGVCHIFVDKEANFDQAINIIIDAKTEYPSACNACETVLVHHDIAQVFLPILGKKLAPFNVIIKGCEQARQIVSHFSVANPDDFGKEFGDLTLALKVVKNVEEAIDHINTWGSHHTDSIITQDAHAESLFLKHIDSASVYVNASTRFADGFRYGFGAEVGISTAKTHARGPVGLEGLIIYKYLLKGEGHCVKDYTGEQAKKLNFRNLG